MMTIQGTGCIMHVTLFPEMFGGGVSVVMKILWLRGVVSVVLEVWLAPKYIGPRDVVGFGCSVVWFWYSFFL